MYGYDKLAHADNKLGRYPAALESQKQALRIAEELLVENPNDSVLKRKQASFLSKVYLLSIRSGQIQNVMQYLREADELCNELLKETPDDVDLLKISSMVLVNNYQEALMAKDEAKASANIRKYAAVYERLANLFPNDETRRAEFTDAQLQLVSYLNNHGSSAEAMTILEQTQKRFASQTGQPTTRSKKLQANLDWTAGDILASLGKNNESESAYTKSAKEFEALLLNFPKTRDLSSSLAQVYWSAGRLWHFAMQPDKARPYLLKAKEILTQFKTDHLDDDQSKATLEYVEEMLRPAKK
jgi:tetratricopeptide (TPR) repeat protein